MRIQPNELHRILNIESKKKELDRLNDTICSSKGTKVPRVQKKDS
jgi:hypothetical protein